MSEEKRTIVEVKGLGKQYMKQHAIKDVDFEIKEGMICGLIGPNGAGKTTIMKALGGLILPTEGCISIFGETSEQGLSNARKRMSFMIETPYAKEKMTARENLEKQRLQKGIPNKERVDEVLKLVGLENTGKKEVRNFSLGMSACILIIYEHLHIKKVQKPFNQAVNSHRQQQRTDFLTELFTKFVK